MADSTPDVNKVFVGNLNRSVTKEDLEGAFSAVGAVTLVDLAPSKRYGWVTFADASAAAAAVGLSGTTIGDSEVRVEAHKPYAPDAQSVFVGRLPLSASEDSVRGLFASYGAIDGVKLVDTRRGEFRNAYVRFATPEAAGAATAANGMEVEGNTLRVEPEDRRRRERRSGSAAAGAGEAGGRRRRRRERPVNPARVWVGNVPRDTSADDLRAVFESCGAIVRVLRKFGFAFVTFEDEASVEAAIALSGTLIGEKEIQVERETKREPKEGDDEPRPARTRGGGRAAAAGGRAAGAGGAGGRRNRRRGGGGGGAGEAEPERPIVSRDDTVWVGNLPEGTTEEALQAALAPYGPITRASVGRNGKFGHVQFEGAAGAQAAIAASDAGAVSHGGNVLSVERERGRPAADPQEVYVGNLPETATEEDIRTFLASAGDIERVSMRGRGIAYVRFATPEMASAATYIQGTINSNQLRVELAQPPRRRRRPRREE